MIRYLILAALAAAVFFQATPASAQGGRAGSETRDVWWVDEDTTLPSTAAPASASVDEAPVVDLDTGKPVDSAPIGFIPEDEPKDAAKPSDILKKTPTAAAKPQAKPESKPSVKSSQSSSREPGYVSYEGTVRRVGPGPDDTLRVEIEQENGRTAVGYANPGSGMRIPGQGSLVRISGFKIVSADIPDTVRIERIDRLGGPERSYSRPTNRYSPPPPPPQGPPRYYYW